MRATLRALVHGFLFALLPLPVLVTLVLFIIGAGADVNPWSAFLPVWGIVGFGCTFAPPLAVIVFGPGVIDE